MSFSRLRKFAEKHCCQTCTDDKEHLIKASAIYVIIYQANNYGKAHSNNPTNADSCLCIFNLSNISIPVFLFTCLQYFFSIHESTSF